MVIQRNWKQQNDSIGNGILHTNTSSSEDSNGSSHTNISTTTNTTGASSKNTMKFVTTPQMAESILARIKHRFGSPVIGPKSSSEAVMRSLELLRINVQSAFDNEIDTVIRKFLELYFKPALKNIKDNLGEHVVSDDVLQKMSCAMLENSKSQYNNRYNRNTTSSAALLLTSSKAEQCTQTIIGHKRVTVPDEKVSPPIKKPNLPPPTSPEIISTKPPSNQRRQIFWNTANISTETRFVLDVQANLAFGFRSDGKERLASKHPELIRYLPDAPDRDWLVEEKIIPPQNRNSRFLFLIYDEVIKLSQSEAYRQRENLNINILQAFKIPNIIIQKMKLFFVDLNIKSRGLITNSYSANVCTAGNSGSHLRNALLQRNHSASASPTVSTSTDSVSTTVPLKHKSLLSSSHATLTALLTNTANSNDCNQQEINPGCE